MVRFTTTLTHGPHSGFRVSFDLALGVPSSVQEVAESWTHVGGLAPGIHMMQCVLDHRWTASRVVGSLLCLADREAGRRDSKR